MKKYAITDKDGILLFNSSNRLFSNIACTYYDQNMLDMLLKDLMYIMDIGIIFTIIIVDIRILK